MVPEHAGTLTCMLIAMRLRRDEYPARRTTIATRSPRSPRDAARPACAPC
jgi:hypothetical protein